MFIVKRQKNTSYFFYLQEVFGDVAAKQKSPIGACVFVLTRDNEALVKKSAYASFV